MHLSNISDSVRTSQGTLRHQYNDEPFDAVQGTNEKNHTKRTLTAPFLPLHFGRHFIAVVFINADYDYSLAVVITGTF
jgi:hypothetical protein